MTAPPVYDGPGSGLPRSRGGLVIDSSVPVQVIIQNAPVMSLYWDLMNAPTVASVNQVTAVGSRPGTASFGALTNVNTPPVNGAYGRLVAVCGSASAVGFLTTTFSMNLTHNAVVVAGVLMKGFRQFIFEVEMAATNLPTNNVAGVAGNCVGFAMQQSDGPGGVGSGGADGLLSSTAAYFAMVAGADGNWSMSAGTKGRAGGPPFPPDVLPVTAVASDILNIHRFTYTYTAATTAADATMTIARDDVALVTVPWTLTSSPRMPGYGSGAQPWWKFGLVGDKTTAGTVGNASLVVASARFLAA